MTELRIGSRTSKLAMWQTEHIAALLAAASAELTVTIVPFVTKGDKTLDKPLPEIGGKGLFTLELETALRTGDIDIAVHSLKDLPVEDPDGLTLGAIVGRADPRDVVIAPAGQTLTNLPPGSVIGTSSLRRQAQILAMRPDLRVEPIRGNVDTRIKKIFDNGTAYAAGVLAAAGVERLGLSAHVSEHLSLEAMLPAPGQGALAIQCRANDEVTRSLLAQIDCPDVRVAVSAERAFLHGLQGGCSTPVAAYATVENDTVSLTGRVLSVDGQREIEVHGADHNENTITLGNTLAQRALKRGAQRLLHG